MKKYINIMLIVLFSAFFSSTAKASIINESSSENLGYLYDFGRFGSFTVDSLLPPLTGPAEINLLDAPNYVCTDSDICPLIKFELEYLENPFTSINTDFYFRLFIEFDFVGFRNYWTYNSLITHPDEHIFSEVGTYDLTCECDVGSYTFTISEIVEPNVVSAPTTLTLFGFALVMLGWFARRRPGVNA